MTNYFNLEDLNTFLIAAETGKLNVTAERTYQSHSTVSAKIKRLEEQAGLPLFTRNKNNLTLSKGGEVLVKYARNLLDQNQAAFNALTGDTWDGHILIGLPTDYAPMFLYHIYPKIKEDLASYQVNVEFSRSRIIRKKLQDRRLDFGILATENPYDDEMPLWSEQLQWVCSRNYIHHAQEPIPIALFSDDCILNNYALNCLKNSNLPFEILFTSTDMKNLQDCVASGAAIALLPASLLTSEMRQVPYEYLLCPYSLRMGCAWNPKTNRQAIQTILDHLQDYTEQLHF